MNDETRAATPLNRLVLTAAIAQRNLMRYSPAGVPVLDCVLTHTSQALEAGAMRQVSANIKAVALGAVAQQLDQQTLGQTAVFEGFIASPASRRSTVAGNLSSSVVLHIQSFSSV